MVGELAEELWHCFSSFLVRAQDRAHTPNADLSKKTRETSQHSKFDLYTTPAAAVAAAEAGNEYVTGDPHLSTVLTLASGGEATTVRVHIAGENRIAWSRQQS